MTEQNEKLDKAKINEMFEIAMKDPNLFSTLDIENLLDSIENINNDYLENKNMNDIIKAVLDRINEIGLSKDETKKICDKLMGYRFIDEIHELRKGKHIRWIRIKDSNAKLTNGGIVVNIKFLNNGIHVLCMGSGNRFIQYKYDDCFTFQKLSMEEQLILLAGNQV